LGSRVSAEEPGHIGDQGNVISKVNVCELVVVCNSQTESLEVVKAEAEDAVLRALD